MKTDKELLGLAAKAAGIAGEWVDDYNPTHDYFYQGNHSGFYAGDFIDGSCTVWNPLTNDGDALRLAVKLGNWSLTYSDDDWEYCNHDGYAATRRAIVRAAAAIGESK